jgi:cytochrome P450
MEAAYRTVQTAPGPRGHWLLGSIPAFKRDILRAIEDGRTTYGDLIRFKLGPKTVYVACSPELAEEILVRQKDVFLKIGANAPKPVGLQLLLGNGLLTNPDYDSWLMQRRLMQPMFHRRSIAALTGQMAAAGEQMLARWQARHAPGATVDISQEMTHVTLDIISRTMFSADVLDQAELIGKAVKHGTAFIFQRNQNPFSPPLRVPTPGNRAFRRTRQALDQIIYALLDARLRDGQAAHKTESGDTGAAPDLLDMLIAARDADTGQGMSREQLRDEIATIFIAGHETTANTLSWAWYLLAQHPDAYQKLQEEVDRVLQGRVPTLDDLPSLPYTAAVFDETLRLFPAAPSLPRRTATATTLNEYAVEAGTQVFVSIYSIHRRADLWDEPEAFRPERFLAEMHKDRHHLAFMPFGAGQRLCIGANFAQLEGQLLLAQIAQCYELRLVPDQRVEPEVAITLRPRGGLRMTLHPRR